MTATTPTQSARNALSPATLWRRWVGRSGPWTPEAIVLLVLVSVLLLIGLVMSLSASFAEDAQSGDPFGTFVNQLRYAVIGLVLYATAARLHHRVWRPLSWLMIVVSLVALLLVVAGAGYTQDGSTRWIAVGPFIVQPSELAKLSTLLWLADVAARKRALLGSDGVLPTTHLLVPAIPLLVVEIVLVMLEPDFGTSILLAAIVAVVLWFEGISLKLVAAMTGVLAVFSTAAISLASYRMARIRGWLHPELDPSVSGYQLLQSLYALGSGGWFGTGLGQSRGKWNFIPNPETDFIFAIIGEELGLVGALLVVLLFSAILVVGLRIARMAPDRFSRLVAAAITVWLVGQAFINIGTVTGLLPITGVTLPLVSVGGSSLVSTLVAFGILTSIARASGAARSTKKAQA